VSEIRPLSDADVPRFVSIAANAYPAMEVHSAEAHERVVQRLLAGQQDAETHLYGLYREGELLGGMRLFDFTMNLRGVVVPAGGVGFVAVDLVHKKEHVAKELIDYFVRHYRERGAPIASLYPFRPDFYRQMGFGYGAKMHQYVVRPLDLPVGSSKAGVVLLGPDDAEALLACAQRVFAQTNGLFRMRQAEARALLDNRVNRVFAYRQGEEVRSFFVSTFKQGKTPVFNNLEVRELFYEGREPLMALLASLRSQADQIASIIFNTQDDEFHFLLSDPRNGTGNMLPHVFHESHVSGVGIMYRVLDLPGLLAKLAQVSFGDVTCTLKLSISDSFLPENASSVVVRFVEGRPTLQPDGDYEVALRLDVAECSSLLVGATRCSSLYRYGLAEVSDTGYLPLLDRLFSSVAKPMCVTRF